MRRIGLITSLLSICIFGFWLSGCSQTKGDPKPGMEIDVTLPDFKAKDTVFLCIYNGKKPYYVDTALLDANKKAIFKSDSSLGKGLYMMLLPDKTYFELIIDEYRHFSVSTKKPQYGVNMQIQNSPENEYFYAYLKNSAVLTKEVKELLANPNKQELAEGKRAELVKMQDQFAKEKPENLFAKYISVQKEPEIKQNPPGDSLFAYRTYMDEFFMYFDFTDKRLLQTPAFEVKLDNFFDNLVQPIPDSITYRADKLMKILEPYPEFYRFSLTYLLNKYAEPKIMGLDNVYVYLANNYYAKGKATWSSKKDLDGILRSGKLLEPLLIGKTAPNIELLGLNGKPVSLYGMKSKYTLLVIWDSGCNRCRARTPLFNKIHKAYRDLGLEVFGATLELEPEPWKAYIKQNGYDWTHGIDQEHTNAFREIYKVDGIPSMYLLDADKKIIAKKLDPKGLANYLDQILKVKRASSLDLEIKEK